MLATPGAFIAALGGLAMLRVLQSSFVTAFSTRFTLGALVTFIVTVADVSVLNVGAAFWGLVAGLLVSWLLERPDFAPPTRRESGISPRTIPRCAMRRRCDPQGGVDRADGLADRLPHPLTLRDLHHAVLDSALVAPRKQVALEPDGECQRRESGGLGRRRLAQHHRVVQMTHQLMLDAAVGLRRPVDRDEPERPVLVEPKHPGRDQSVLHSAAGLPGQVPDPVVGLVRLGLTDDGGQGAIEQPVLGRRRIDHGDVRVDESHPFAQHQIEQQRSTEPEVEVCVLDQELTGGVIVGQQEQIFGEGDHV